MVGLAERHALAHEVVCQVGGEHVRGERLEHVLGLNGQGAEHAGGDLRAVADGLDVVEHGLNGLLQVLVVG